MLETLPALVAASLLHQVLYGGIIIAALVFLLLLAIVVNYGALWFQAYMSDVDVSFMSLVGMSFRQVKPSMIVRARIMVRQAGVSTAQDKSMDTPRLEAHVLAGGDIMHVVRAIIAAHRAGLDLDFDRAAAIDLAGRDVLDAVQTSVSPKVIDCPDSRISSKIWLSAVARDGVELRVRARVTVRTNLDQLIGGATEETIIARVGQGIITAIGSSVTHKHALEQPDCISRSVLEHGLDANTAFEIVSLDIADIDIGENIGARLQTDQAAADTRVAQASAEVRRAKAIADQQEMVAKVVESQALLILAEVDLPKAIATAFRTGQLKSSHPPGHRTKSAGKHTRPTCRRTPSTRSTPEPKNASSTEDHENTDGAGN